MFSFISRDTGERNITEEYINRFENENGFKFPEILANYYKNHNKAELNELSFMIGKYKFSVDFIIPLRYGTVCVEKIREINKEYGDVPETFMPLAEDTDGQNFYWDTVTGKVYYLELQNAENPIPICNSVERFFEILNNTYEAGKVNVMTEWIPLGSIVLLKGGAQKVLIIARALNVKNGGEEYFFDYGGVTYPEGLMGDQIAYFNADKISKVVFKGYSDVDDENMVDNIDRYIETHPNLKWGSPEKWRG